MKTTAVALALSMGSQLMTAAPAVTSDIADRGSSPQAQVAAIGSISAASTQQTPTQGASPPGPGETTAGDPRVLSVMLSDQTPLIGERFDLTVVARIPPNHNVRFPDSLFTRTAIESIAVPFWTVAAGPGDSTDVTIVYPLRSLAWGRLAVPETELLVERMRAGPSVPDAPVVTAWAAGANAIPGLFTRHAVTPAWVEVPQVLPPANPLAGFRPEPALDVVGSEWGPARIGLAGVAAVAAGWATLLIVAFVRKRVAVPLARAARLRALRQARARRGPGVHPRDRALAEIDDLLRLDFDDPEGLAEYHVRGTRSARGYLGRVDGSNALARTYRELIAELAAREGAGAGAADTRTGLGAVPVPSIDRILRRAEDLRYGEARVTPAEVREDLVALREWVTRYPSGQDR